MSENFGRTVNRFHKVPAINDDGFKLAESVAIFHYLGRKTIIPERWYPSDIKALTRIDEYLQWQHNNLLTGAGMLFYMQMLTPMKTGVLPTQKAIDQQMRTLIKNLDDLENIWLKDNKFLAGSEVSFADLMAASAMEQIIGLKLFSFESNKHQKVQKWLEEVRTFFGPTFKEAHHFVYKWGDMLSEAKKK